MEKSMFFLQKHAKHIEKSQLLLYNVTKVVYPALCDKFYILRQPHFVKGNRVRVLMSGHEGFRVESESIASVKDRGHSVDYPPCFSRLNPS